MVKAYGKTLEECYANAGYALFDQTVDLSTVEPRDVFRIDTAGEDAEERLHTFLSELLWMEDTYGMVLCELSVDFRGRSVTCFGRGETLDRNKHRVKSEIKAVTYHMMSVDPKEPSVTVIFDV